MKKMTHFQIERYLKDNINNQVPESVISNFLKAIEYKNDSEPNYTVETQENNGIITIGVTYNNALNSYVQEDKYTITINNDNSLYTIMGKKTGYEWSVRGKEISSHKVEKKTIKNDPNAWNSQPGWILETEERVTAAKRGTDALEPYKLILNDTQTNSTIRYDESGVALAEESNISYYPKREGIQFTFGLPERHMARPEQRYVNYIVRTSLCTMENQITGYDMMGDKNYEQTNYYTLNYEHNLGNMDVCMPISYEKHEKSINYYNNLEEEELNKLLANTPSPTREGLESQYYQELTIKNGHKR